MEQCPSKYFWLPAKKAGCGLPYLMLAWRNSPHLRPTPEPQGINDPPFQATVASRCAAEEDESEERMLWRQNGVVAMGTALLSGSSGSLAVLLHFLYYFSSLVIFGEPNSSLVPRNTAWGALVTESAACCLSRTALFQSPRPGLMGRNKVFGSGAFVFQWGINPAY